MRRVTLKWPIAGAVLGALGSLLLLLCVEALVDGVDFGNSWEGIVAVLCPPAILLRGFWWPLGLNCALYALLLSGLRWTWICFRS